MSARFSIFALMAVVAFVISATAPSKADEFAIVQFPIPEALISASRPLHGETLEWMQRWKGLSLEDQATFQLTELSGSTSINAKIHSLPPGAADGKAMGTLVIRNAAANPNMEIAYFNLSAIVSRDSLFRPAVRHILGPKGRQALLDLVSSASFKGKLRNTNKERIVRALQVGSGVKGCIKAKKSKSAVPYDFISPDGYPRRDHPLIQALQAANPKPSASAKMTLRRGYVGSTAELARELSIMMTFDAIFDQWDRYSGGNIVIRKDSDGAAHFYFTDNGGADFGTTTSRLEKNLESFSRYDREVIVRLRDLYRFLNNSTESFLGYTDSESFVGDLGLYFELSAREYVKRLKRNLGRLLDRVSEIEAEFGEAGYF